MFCVVVRFRHVAGLRSRTASGQAWDPNPTDDEGEGIVHGTMGSPRAVELRERHGDLPALGRWTSSEPPDPEAVG